MPAGRIKPYAVRASRRARAPPLTHFPEALLAAAFVATVSCATPHVLSGAVCRRPTRRRAPSLHHSTERRPVETRRAAPVASVGRADTPHGARPGGNPGREGPALRCGADHFLGWL